VEYAGKSEGLSKALPAGSAPAPLWPDC
jgi:hypothetical protein